MKRNLGLISVLALSLAAPALAADPTLDEVNLAMTAAQMSKLPSVSSGLKDLDSAAKSLNAGPVDPVKLSDQMGKFARLHSDLDARSLLDWLNSPDASEHADAIRAAGARLGKMKEAEQRAVVIRVVAIAEDGAEPYEAREEAYRGLGRWLRTLTGDSNKRLALDGIGGALYSKTSLGRSLYRLPALEGLRGSLAVIPKDPAVREALEKALAAIAADPREDARARALAGEMLTESAPARPGN